MPDEIRIPVNAKIPKCLHDSLLVSVENGVYKDKTACITEALEKLLNNTHEETQHYTSVLQEKETEIQNYKNELQAKYAEIQRLQSVIQEAPNPVELAEIKGHFEGLKIVLEEKDKRIEELNKHIEDISPFANYYKNKELKQLEAPANEKKKPWYKRIFSN